MAILRETCNFTAMNILIMFILLLLMFGVGGFLFGGPIIGGGALGLILLVALMIYFTEGFPERPDN